jgi:asparagine synthetase B (glutamine-hydrolysing)
MKTAEGGVVAVGGQPIVTQPTDAAALLHPEVVAWHARALRELTERLDGHYAVVSIRADGSGTIVSDPFGFHPLYLGHTGSVSVVSNRPGLVAAVLERVTGRALAPDEEAVAWVLLNGQMFGDGTGYHGVRRLPFGSCAELEPEKGVYIRQWYETPWPRRDVASVPVGESIDRVEQRMIATIRAALAATPGAVSSELTAGKDTRLILELAFRAGVADQLCFCTYPTSSQDGDIAARIAAHLGLRHEARPWPARPIGPTLESFVEHVRNTAAQLGCWETSNAPETEGITLSGLAGESLKTNYPKKVGLTTVEAATEGFDTHRWGRYDYVRSSALEDLRSRGRQLFLAPLEGGARPEDLFDIFYLQHRHRRWTADKPDRFVRYVLVLYSPVGVRAAMAAGWEERTSAVIHEEIRRRAHLPIDHISFGKGAGWRTRDQPAAASGVPSAPALPSNRERTDAIREAIEFEAANRAFELVDREAMLRDLDRYSELDRRAKMELHHALTVVLWLGLARPDRPNAQGLTDGFR